MYTTIDNGSTPYSKKVKTAPNTLPLLLVASTTAIISTTYNHPMTIKYMPYYESVNYNVKNSVMGR